MKKIISVFAVICLVLMAPMVFAVENGAGVKSGQVTLYNQATGATAAQTPAAVTFDNVMKYGACDFISGPTTTASALTFVIKGNMASVPTGTTVLLFDSTAYLLTTTTLTTSTTVTVMKTAAFNSGVAAPFRTIQLTVTSPTYTTQLITANCVAVQ